MDLEIGLIVVGVVAVTAVTVYLVSVMGIKEKSFEEAIAEQKKRSDDLLGRKEKKKVTVKEKTKKQKKAKEKEKPVVAVVGDLSDDTGALDVIEKPVEKPIEEKHHVEIDPEPEIMEHPPAPESRRASVVKRRESIKSILVNKEEHSPVVEQEVQIAVNHFETSHPKDDCELLKKQTSYEESPPPSPPPPLPQRNPKKIAVGNGKKEDLAGSGDGRQILANSSGVYENVPNVLEDQIDSVNSDSLKSARPGSPAEKGAKNRKGKKAAEQDKDEPNAAKLENTIERVSLSSSEIQKLIDVLLNKQHAGDSEWINKGKNDNIGNLKKQLLEHERQLTEERATVQNLQLKLKELRQEFTTEKGNFGKVKKQLEDVSSQKAHDIQQLTLRLQQMRDGNLGEKQALQQQLQQMQLKLNQMRDDNVAMKNALSIEQSTRGKAESLEREADALRTQCGHLENQLKVSFQSNEGLTNQVMGLQEHLRALEERKKQEEHNIHASYRAQIQERETHLLAELKKAQDLITETEKDRTNLQQQIVILQTSVRNSTEASKNLEDVTKKLEDTQKAEKNVKNLLEDAKIKLSDLQERLLDEDKHAKKLEEEKESLAAQVTSLTERIAAKDQESEKINGDLQSHENSQASIHLDKISALETKLEEKDIFTQKLDTENKNLKNQLDRSSQDAKAQKEKNDELRLTNTKLMDTLNVTEKNLEVRIIQSKELVLEERTKTRQDVENSLKETFQKLFPNITITKGKADWAADLAKSIQEELKQAKESISVDSKSISSVEAAQLQEVNARLQEEVLHYQNVLSSTESLLSNLQGSIEKEERNWQLKFQQKEAELNALKSSAPSATNGEVAQLKGELEGEREEKSVLSQRCSELENNVQNLKKQIDQYESLRKTLVQLEADLGEEKKKSQDLMTENTNLNSVVKSCQESSAAELDKVKSLEGEIAQLKSQLATTTTNGVANGTGVAGSVADSLVVKGAAATTLTENPNSLASTSSSTHTSNPTNADTPKEKPKKKKGASAKR